MLHIPALHQQAASQIWQDGFEKHTEKLSFHSLGSYCRTSFYRELQTHERWEAKYICVPMQPAALRSRQAAQVVGAARPFLMHCHGSLWLAKPFTLPLVLVATGEAVNNFEQSRQFTDIASHYLQNIYECYYLYILINMGCI